MGKKSGLEWDFVTRLEQKGRGSYLCQCKFCPHQWTGVAQRIRAHILNIPGHGVGKCLHAPKEVKDICRRLHLQATGIAHRDANEDDHVDASAVNDARGQTNDANVDACGSSSMSNDASIMNKRQRVLSDTQPHGKLAQAWQMQSRNNAHIAVRRFFYAEDIPLCKVQSPFFLDMVKAIGEVGPSYKPPSYDALRVKELKDEVSCVDRELLGIRDKWKKYGCTIVCDGWSDTKKRPIINVLASCIYGSVFLKSVDTSGQVKSGEYIFDILKDVILDIGPTNVIQVCMDNASNCVRAGELIETEWPHIFFTRCTCHCLDLLFEDIGRLSWVSPVLDSARKIVKFITRKPTLLALFRTFSTKELLKPADTRFAYMFIMLSNLLDERVYSGLRKMVVSDAWTNAKAIRNRAIGLEITSKILETKFWQDAREIVTIMAPILTILRMADREGATMGLVYELTDRMVEKLENMTDVDAIKLNEVKALCLGRWNMMHSPLHAAGYVLHPIWRGKGQEADAEIQDGWMTFIERYTYGNLEEQGHLMDQLDDYRSLKGTFSRPLALDESRMHEAVKWWESFGASTPKLQQLAIRVLSLGTTASPCERNWSTFSLIHTKRRNRLKPSNVEKLVYIHTNLRLISKIKARGYEKIEVTLAMVHKERDDERLTILQEMRETVEDECIEMHARDANDVNIRDEEIDEDYTSSSSSEEEVEE